MTLYQKRLHCFGSHAEEPVLCYQQPKHNVPGRKRKVPGKKWCVSLLEISCMHLSKWLCGWWKFTVQMKHGWTTTQRWQRSDNWLWKKMHVCSIRQTTFPQNVRPCGMQQQSVPMKQRFCHKKSHSKHKKWLCLWSTCCLKENAYQHCDAQLLSGDTPKMARNECDVFRIATRVKHVFFC